MGDERRSWKRPSKPFSEFLDGVPPVLPSEFVNETGNLAGDRCKSSVADELFTCIWLSSLTGSTSLAIETFNGERASRPISFLGDLVKLSASSVVGFFIVVGFVGDRRSRGLAFIVG